MKQITEAKPTVVFVAYGGVEAQEGETAAKRDAHFVDIFNPILEVQKKAKITDNDIHLNEADHYHLALALAVWKRKNSMIW